MKFFRRILPAALLAALLAPATRAAVPIGVIAGSETSFEGMLQADYNWFSSDVTNLNGDAHDGRNGDGELRRAEFVLKGKGPGNLEWVVGYDAKADKWLDTNLKYKFGGNGNHSLQIGQYKQPNSLEELGSARNNDFISKAMVANTWALGRRLGAAYSYGDDSWSITGSAFTRELKRGLNSGDGFGARGTWAPINQKGSILHLGLSYANYNAELPVANGTNTSTQRWRARPQADLAGVRLIDTGTIANADKASTTGVEAFWVSGPLKLQAEYMRNNTSRSGGLADFSGSGGYVGAVWNVTGETWGYKAGTPSTPQPNEPVAGMLQLGLRYDTMDLDDGSVDTSGATPVVTGILGGKMDTWTVGANYYWHSNFKFALNYVKANSSKYSSTARKVVNDDPSILEFRAQLFW